MKAKKTAKINPNKGFRQQEAEEIVGAAVQRMAAEATPTSPLPLWQDLASVSAPGLYVQKNTPNGRPVFEVVRVVFVLGGDKSLVKVTTPDGNEEHNPLIVCHSTYQSITE